MGYFLRDVEENGAPGLLSSRSMENQESIWSIDEDNLNSTDVMFILAFSFETQYSEAKNLRKTLVETIIEYRLAYVTEWRPSWICI